MTAMWTLEIGNKMKPQTRSAQAGFTLVEMLAALTIMAMMTSVVVLTLPSDESRFRSEVRQLAARLELAAQESIVGGRQLGLTISDQGYSFQHLRGDEWELIANDKTFSSHDWSAQTQIIVERDSFFPANTDRSSMKAAEAALPELRFDPTGLPARFSIRIARSNARYVIESNGRSLEVSDASL